MVLHNFQFSLTNKWTLHCKMNFSYLSPGKIKFCDSFLISLCFYIFTLSCSCVTRTIFGSYFPVRILHCRHVSFSLFRHKHHSEVRSQHPRGLGLQYLRAERWQRRYRWRQGRSPRPTWLKLCCHWNFLPGKFTFAYVIIYNFLSEVLHLLYDKKYNI